MHGLRGLTRRGLLLNGGKPEINITCPAITPTLGAELLTDPGLENWASATNLTSWTELVGGTSTVNREGTEKHGGSYSGRHDIDAGDNYAQIYQGVTAAAGVFLHVSFWARASASGKTLFCISTNSGGAGPTRNPGTTWTQYHESRRVTTANPNIGFVDATAASASIYFDDISVKAITFTSMIALLGNRSPAPGNYQCTPTATVGTKAGMLIRYTDASNFVMVIVDRQSETAKLIKCIAGTYTDVISGSITYGDAKILKATIAANGTDYSLYYDGVQVGVQTAIADAGLGSGVYGFNAFAGNTVGTVTTNP